MGKREARAAALDAKACPGSFNTPDGTTHWCQHKRGRGHGGPCFYNVVRHPVKWSGAAKGDFCGNVDCPGGVAYAEAEAIHAAAAGEAGPGGAT